MFDIDMRLAILEVKGAENRFNNATGRDIDIAIWELLIAEEKLNQLIRDKKQAS